MAPASVVAEQANPVQLSEGEQVTVEVPATSANLGPGFDCFGLALDWRESVRLEVMASGYHIEVSGEGADQIPRDESHLIMRSALVGLADLGVTAPGLRLSCHNTIPHGRGLGSSSAAIVAGLVAAGSLAGRRVDREWLLGHADAIEGHPDNVAAAIYGGFVMAYDSVHGIAVAQGAVADGLGVVLYVPDTPVATHAARNLLPDEVPHADAASNSGRAALFAHAMASDSDLLWDATRDWLHQDYRQRAMPASYDLMVSLRSQGLAAVISGAGPTVLVIGRADDLAQLPHQAVRGFRIMAAAIGPGARVVDRTTPKSNRA
ncbi:MAG: homoserine kinase [Propionibacteriaceae bacterium]